MKKLWLGRYISIPSFYHSLDPRVKLLMMVLNIIMIIFISTWSKLLLAISLTILCIFLSKIPLSFYVKQAMFLKYIFFTLTEGSDVLFTFGIFRVTIDGFLIGLFYAIKMILFVMMGALLTFTTAPSEIVTATKALVKNQSMEQFAFMTSLAIRLIPMILDEVKLIYAAQQSRGLDFSEIPFKEKLSKLMSIIIPAISNTIKRLTMMMDAMECRGYIVGKNRTSIYQLRWKMKDSLVLMSGLLVLASIILI